MIKAIILFICLTLAFAQKSTDNKEIINQDEFSAEALMAHNLYRKIHGVAPLKLNKKLVDLAVSRAKELAEGGKLNVKQILFKGENLGETVGTVGGFSSYNGISATQLWYSVVSKFDEEGESSNEGASFTQMVWKKTEEVGFGIAKAKDGKFFFVAEYFPSGNIRGQYEDNVFQLTDEEMTDKKCVKQSVVDMWKKMLVKANIKIEEENIKEISVKESKKDEEKEEDKTIKVETPVTEERVELTNKKLKSNLPILTTTTKNMEIKDESMTKEIKFKVTEVIDSEKNKNHSEKKKLNSAKVEQVVVENDEMKETTKRPSVTEMTEIETKPVEVILTTKVMETVTKEAVEEETTTTSTRTTTTSTEEVKSMKTTTKISELESEERKEIEIEEKMPIETVTKVSKPVTIKITTTTIEPIETKAEEKEIEKSTISIKTTTKSTKIIEIEPETVKEAESDEISTTTMTTTTTTTKPKKIKTVIESDEITKVRPMHIEKIKQTTTVNPEFIITAAPVIEELATTTKFVKTVRTTTEAISEENVKEELSTESSKVSKESLKEDDNIDLKDKIEKKIKTVEDEEEKPKKIGSLPLIKSKLTKEEKDKIQGIKEKKETPFLNEN